MNSVSGSSTMIDTKPAKCSRKKESQSAHNVFVPAIITFTSRPECEPVW